jgi:predicted aconitase
VELTGAERDMVEGRRGDAVRLAMRILLEVGRAQGAERLIEVASAHVDGCLYHGQASLDFAERLSVGGARVVVPTTLNVGTLDLLHPDRFRGDPETAARGRRLMELYAAMGCRPTWTCAPYQAADARPAFGEHVAWAESNAIVFANSVLGARTDRYGDFIDICAAITGRVPEAGLHLPEHRRGRVLFRLRAVPARLLGEDVLYPVLGHLIGATAGSRVPVIEGLPADAKEDQLKALGAAAASSGAVALFHAVGITPEAPTTEQALGGQEPDETVDVGPEALRRARDALSTSPGPVIDAVSVGTPHFSKAELDRLVPLVSADPPLVPFYASTARDVLQDFDGLADLEHAGVRMVTDTCTYITPILDEGVEVVMTYSGKWAYYAPGNIGVHVVFGSLEECVRSAALGRVWRDPDLWADDGG